MDVICYFLRKALFVKDNGEVNQKNCKANQPTYFEFLKIGFIFYKYFIYDSFFYLKLFVVQAHVPDFIFNSHEIKLIKPRIFLINTLYM